MKTFVLTLSTKFPATHYLRGQETDFFQKIKDGTKIHTIRANFPLWKKRFEKINAGEACLSIRYWTGKPYASKQEEFLKLTKDDGIGIQVLQFNNSDVEFPKIVKQYTTEWVERGILAKNDGLSLDDFVNWFKGYDLSNPLAIIHFTKFRY